MATREIPHGEWAAFCNEFNRQHQGWLATVEVKGGNVGDHIEMKSLPFLGLSYEEKGTNEGALDVFMGRGTQTNETHSIPHPTHLRIESDNGKDKGFEIQARDGTTTTVRFDNPARPENVDRI